MPAPRPAKGSSWGISGSTSSSSGQGTVPHPPSHFVFSSSRPASSASSSSFVLIGMAALAMLFLSGVAAAFRPSSSSGNMHRLSSSSSSSSARAFADNSDNTQESSRNNLQEQNRSQSFGMDVVEAAGSILQRHRRTYWEDLAPPFGIRSGILRKRKKKRRREAAKITATTARSVATGTLLEERSPLRTRGGGAGDVDEGDDDDSSLDSFLSEHTWDDDERNDITDAAADLMPPLPEISSKTTTHICFLVHGHRGQSRDLGYLHAAIQGRSSEMRRRQRREMRRRLDTADPNDDARKQMFSSFLGHNVVVHSAVCNEGRTKDGVRAGGERLVEEMLQVIRGEADRRRQREQRLRKKIGDVNQEDEDNVVDITLSLVGNSLGGIYSRFAVARLYHMSETSEDGDSIFLDDGKIRIYFQTFCSTATPHLGCSNHTWISLPRSAEMAVGHILGETGRDLFRMTDLLHTMSTEQYYLSPLSKFKKRVAYANGYHTDFPVPAATAAFLHEESTYPHHFWEEGMSGSGDSELDKYIVAVMHTQPSSSSLDRLLVEECDDELKAMSTALDSLGWKKVIVDLRHEILGVSVPSVVRNNSLIRKKSSRKSLSSSQREGSSAAGVGVMQDTRQERFLAHDAESDNNDEDLDEHLKNGTLADSVAHRDSLRRKAIIASRVAKAAFASPRDGSIHLPVGHNMICAFSRGRVSSHMNRGGRPVMDNLAREMVEDMIFGGEHASE